MSKLLTPFDGRIVTSDIVEYERGPFKLLSRLENHQKFNSGELTQAFDWLVFHSASSVAVLIHDTVNDAIVLIEQPRASAKSYLFELPAGRIDHRESAKQAAKREALEEVGYRLTKMRRMGGFFTSPGATDEFLSFYYAAVTPDDKVAAGGGLEEEGETIRVHLVSIADAIKMVNKGIIRAAPANYAITWLEKEILKGNI